MNIDAHGPSPQLKNGFTPLANELLEALIRQKLHGREWAVIMAVARHTYGYQRKTHCITGGDIAAMTTISPNHARDVVAGLLAKKILHRINGCLGLQKDYSLWMNSPLQGASPPDGVPRTRGGKRPVQGAQLAPQTGHLIKERNKKEINGIPFLTFWKSWPRKLDRCNAEKLWDKLAENDRQAVLQDITHRHWPEDKQYIMGPAKYLRGQRWEDEGSSNQKEASIYVRADA